MKVFVLEVSGAAYPLHITQLGHCRALANGTRLRVTENLMKALANGPFAPYLRVIEQAVVNTPMTGALEFVEQITAAASVDSMDVDQIARNMGMAGKPGRRHKTKNLG